MNFTFAGPILILIFLLITYIISAYEKINKWQTTKAGFTKMFENTFVVKIIVPLLILIVVAEVITSTYAALGIWDIIKSENPVYATYSFLAASILNSFLLIGLRMINDHKGAARIAVYFLVSIFGLYWTQSIISIA